MATLAAALKLLESNDLDFAHVRFLLRSHPLHRKIERRPRDAPELSRSLAVLLQRPWHCSLEDVAAIRRQAFERIESRLRHAPILGKHFARGMDQPIRDERRVFLRELAVVEDEQEFASARPQPLKRMRNAGRKIPEIARRNIFHITRSVVIDGGQTAGSVEHQRPLIGGVPVKLPDAARRQPHIDAGNLGRDRECLHIDLPRPAAVLNTPVRRREGIPECRREAAIGRRRPEHVGVDRFQRIVFWAGIAGACVAFALSRHFMGLRLGSAHEGGAATDAVAALRSPLREMRLRSHFKALL